MGALIQVERRRQAQRGQANRACTACGCLLIRCPQCKEIYCIACDGSHVWPGCETRVRLNGDEYEWQRSR